MTNKPGQLYYIGTNLLHRSLCPELKHPFFEFGYYATRHVAIKLARLQHGSIDPCPICFISKRSVRRREIAAHRASRV